MAVKSAMVQDFRPSVAAFHFANRWPDEPLFTIDLGVVKVPVGNAAGGLCGGMAFAVRDFWQARVGIPPEQEPPARDRPVYQFIAQRLWDSWDVPAGPVRYLTLMQPETPDDLLARIAGALDIPLPGGLDHQHGRAWIMINREWPLIREDLHRGRLAALGLVKIISSNPLDLGHNHQVLAYGYTLDGTLLTLNIYDPNWPDADDVTLSIDTANPEQPTPVHYHSPAAVEEQVFCFFRGNYQFKRPWKKVVRSVL